MKTNIVALNILMEKGYVINVINGYLGTKFLIEVQNRGGFVVGTAVDYDSLEELVKRLLGEVKLC